MKTIVPILVALILGVGAVLVGQRILQQRPQAQGPTTKTAKVVIAKTELAPGRQIQADDIRVADLPADAVPEGVITKTEDAIGRVLAVQLTKNQSVLASAFAPSDAGKGLQALVPMGKRAVTVQVDEFGGMVGLITPGCHVNIITTLIDDRTKQTISRTILENIRVTAVGTNFAQKTDDRGAAPTRATSVTLLVTPQQAEAIDLATSKGRLRLVLRGGQDGESIRTGGMTISQLIGGGILPNEAIDAMEKRMAEMLKAFEARMAAQAAPQPQPQPVAATPPGPVRRSIQVIKGGAETTKTVELVEGTGGTAPRVVPERGN